MNTLPRISGILCGIITFCFAPVAKAEFFQAPSPEIVSSWKANGSNVVLVFGYDGTYYQIQGDAADPGMERGTFEWDNETGAFSVDTIVDTNGEGGLSHPTGATTVSIGGTGNNTLSLNVAGEGTFSFTRVVNPASAIVGTWTEPGVDFCITFLSDLTYYHVQANNHLPDGYTGMEKGTYTWNPTTKAFTASATIDTNGDVGLGEVAPGVTINVTGNTLVFTEGLEIFTLTRITTNPTPLRLPDFGTVRFAEYLQTSNSAPAPKPFSNLQDSYPFSAEVFVDFVGATAPTLKIGAGTPISLEADSEDPSDFSIEQGYATLAELNTILPASTALQFKNGTATANMTTGASLTFPSIPKILIGSGASFSSGVYRFGENEVLQWTLPTGFVASQYVTVLSVYDPSTGQDVVDAEIQGDVTFYDLGGKLEPGKQYEAELEFYRIDASTTAGNGVFTGKQGHTLSASSTFFRVRARNVFPEDPFINVQPVSQAGTTGSPLLLTVGINEGAFPFSTFQWFRNNQQIEGQTGNSLFIPSFNPDDHSGRYKVVVSNGEGDVESNLANVGRVGTNSRQVQNLVAYKIKSSEQQSATLLTPIGATFDARVEGIGITSTFPSNNITLTKPAGSTVPLALDEDHWDAETDFASFAALQTAFPNGTYKINIGSDSIPINLSATNYPNQPLVTSSVGTWVNGKLQITVSQAAAGFTLTSNATTGDGFVDLSVTDIATDNDIVYEVANTIPSDPDFVTATIAPNQITLGKSYEVEVEFDEVVDSANLFNQTWGGPPDGTANAFGILSTATSFTLEVVPDPVGNLYTLWQARFFNAIQLANPAISGDEVDFDNDGIANILEFILGGNPTTPSPNLLRNTTTTSTPATVGRNLVFSYDRKTEANGIGQVIETSSTLTGTWTPVVHGVNGVVITTATLDATTQRVTATIPSTQAMLFVRLNATR